MKNLLPKFGSCVPRSNHPQGEVIIKELKDGDKMDSFFKMTMAEQRCASSPLRLTKKAAPEKQTENEKTSEADSNEFAELSDSVEISDPVDKKGNGQVDDKDEGPDSGKDGLRPKRDRRSIKCFDPSPNRNKRLKTRGEKMVGISTTEAGKGLGQKPGGRGPNGTKMVYRKKKNAAALNAALSAGESSPPLPNA